MSNCEIRFRVYKIVIIFIIILTLNTTIVILYVTPMSVAIWLQTTHAAALRLQVVTTTCVWHDPGWLVGHVYYVLKLYSPNLDQVWVDYDYHFVQLYKLDIFT